MKNKYAEQFSVALSTFLFETGADAATRSRNAISDAILEILAKELGTLIGISARGNAKLAGDLVETAQHKMEVASTAAHNSMILFNSIAIAPEAYAVMENGKIKWLKDLPPGAIIEDIEP